MFDFLNLTTGSSGKIVEKLQGWLNELLKLKPPLEVTGFLTRKQALPSANFSNKTTFLLAASWS
jgi:hypothetical protein